MKNLTLLLLAALLAAGCPGFGAAAQPRVFVLIDIGVSINVTP